MSIEHRWTPRLPARMAVSIASRRHGLLRARLRNISNGGAMVQIRTPLTPHMPVELILSMRSGKGERTHRLPAIVTRCNETGAGLMFGRIEPDLWTALLKQFVHKENDASAKEAEPIRPLASRS